VCNLGSLRRERSEEEYEEMYCDVLRTVEHVAAVFSAFHTNSVVILRSF